MTGIDDNLDAISKRLLESRERASAAEDIHPESGGLIGKARTMLGRYFSHSPQEPESGNRLVLSRHYRLAPQMSTTCSEIGVGVYQGEVVILCPILTGGNYQARQVFETIRIQDLCDKQVEYDQQLRWAADVIESRLQSDPVTPDSQKIAGTEPVRYSGNGKSRQLVSPSSSASGDNGKTPTPPANQKELGQAARQCQRKCPYCPILAETTGNDKEKSK